MTLTAARLLETLRQLPQASCCHLGFSGGLDSCVLLHLLAELRPQLPCRLRAIHVHHGLQAEADAMQGHCERICDSHGIPLDNVPLTLSPTAGESLEAVAREARYQAFAERMGEGDLLLTAQHRDDQAETLLLQLLRGSGPAGLAAMPLLARFAPGWLARPLLQESRQTLDAYARQHTLTWHEDPSNQDLRFDRNFIRHQIMPLLRSRWPAASTTLSRAARFSGELLTLAKEEAEEDLAKARYGDSDSLSIPALKRLHSIRLRNLLRHWITACGATMPNSKKLARIERESVHGRIDTVPLVTWGGWEVRRYREELRLGYARPAGDPIGPLHWSDKRLLELPDGLGRLIAKPGEGGIRAVRWWEGMVEVRFRRGGERCHPAGRAHHRPLKKLLQEWGIPPWERDRLPLIYLDGELVAIPGRIICRPFMAIPGEEAILVDWEKASPEN
ncbi:MAG: tRNA lysidine(34) synthetase TilS [Candidatus Thiodiazotropha sp. (ex Epidulcina cf. delphinae)]|nr:tRNA lysidine(34) synthetase TilS [Candidatus Thiodiazotropha sp. (ex Epidulcina cf. delphinae)]